MENENGKYKFADSQTLKAGAFYVLNNTESRLAFKNSSDAINLFNDLDELVDAVAYSDATQAESYGRGENGRWFWTTKITPGAENVINLSDSKSVVLTKASGDAGQAEDYVETDLEKIKDMEIGSLLKVKGTVAVEPGVLGTQIFYIIESSEPSASSTADFSAAVLTDMTAAPVITQTTTGVQIYNYKKDFPALKTGDYLEVNGELTQTQGEFRLKTKFKDDIKIMEHKSPPPAIALSCDAINEENVGQLVTLTGEITSKKSYTAYLDDGSDETLVYFKQSAGLDTKSLKAGQSAALTGILSKTSTGLRLLPRYQSDIVIVDQAAETPRVLGETIESSEWAIAERDKKIELFKYLLIMAAGEVVVLGGLFFKAKRKKE